MLLHIIIRKSSKFYWLEQSYRKYYYSRFPLYDSDACISGTPPPVALPQAATFHQAVCECCMGMMDHGALSAASSSCTTQVEQWLILQSCQRSTPKSMKLSGRQPARSPTLSQFSTPFQVSYLGLIRLLCHLWSWGNDASPQWKNGTYTTVVSPSPPNTRFLQRWREK